MSDYMAHRTIPFGEKNPIQPCTNGIHGHHRLLKFESKFVSDTICLELAISEKKWCLLLAYGPPQNKNLNEHLS